MTVDETLEVSRRTFLSGVAGTALAGSGSDSIGRATPTSEGATRMGRDRVDRFGQPGSPSRKAERAWAEAEYNHYRRMREGVAQQDDPDEDGADDGSSSGGAESGSPTAPSFDRTLDAVKDVGCDPSGNRPISEDLNGSMQDGTLIVFPPGDYLLSGKFQANVDGTFGMVGAGYQSASSPPKPGENTATFVADADSRTRINFRATTGLFANVVMDQRSSNSSTGIVVGSSGFVQARDVRFVGVQDNTGEGVPDRLAISPCALQSKKDTTVRAERVVGQYIGLPGDKNSGGAPMFWVGSGNNGTAQIGHCISQGSADNGVYGGRTSGNVQIKGGQWINNEVSQLRFSGQGSWADGATLVVDADRYEGPSGDGGFNDKFGTFAVKIERGDNGYAKPGGAILRNCDIRTLSTGSHGISASVRVRGSGGALKIENCRLVNQLDVPTVLAEPPGQGYSGAKSPPPHNITITDSLFLGSRNGGIVSVSGRDNSLIRKTCFKIPGTGPNAINGMKIGSGVGFGETCSAGGLKAPEKVGSAGNLSAVPINGSYASGGAGRSGPSKGVLATVLGGTLMILFVMLASIGAVVGAILGALSALGGLVGGD